MVFPRPVLGVVFDMDGLLIDSEAVWRDAQIAEAEALGRALPLSVTDSMIGLPHPETRSRLQAHFGQDFDLEAFIAGAIGRCRTVIAGGVALKTGVTELLDLLDEMQAPRAIATSSTHGIVAEHLGHNGLQRRFHAIVAHGDYPRGKPHPDPYLTAARALDLPPSACLALEDSHNGVRAAHAAGMMTVMVPDLLAPTDEMHGLCVAVMDTLHHVREALLASRAA